MLEVVCWKWCCVGGGVVMEVVLCWRWGCVEGGVVLRVVLC